MKGYDEGVYSLIENAPAIAPGFSFGGNIVIRVATEVC